MSISDRNTDIDRSTLPVYPGINTMYLHQHQTRNNGTRRIDEVWRHFSGSVNMTFIFIYYLFSFFKLGYSYRAIAGNIIDMDPRREGHGWMELESQSVSPCYLTLQAKGERKVRSTCSVAIHVNQVNQQSSIGQEVFLVNGRDRR